MTAAQEARAALKALGGACEQAQKDLDEFRRAAATEGDADAAFAVLHARLAGISRAIGLLPRRLTRLEPGLPWPEFERLPALLARPDLRHDRKILDVTLFKPLRQLRSAAARLNLAVADDPYLLDTGYD